MGGRRRLGRKRQQIQGTGEYGGLEARQRHCDTLYAFAPLRVGDETGETRQAATGYRLCRLDGARDGRSSSLWNEGQRTLRRSTQIQNAPGRATLEHRPYGLFLPTPGTQTPTRRPVGPIARWLVALL